MRLPRLRHDLDSFPSPVADRQGLVLRDSMQYSDAVLLIPWEIAPCLDLLDGHHDEIDFAQELVRITGQLDTGSLRAGFLSALRESGFLVDETFEALRALKQNEFREAGIREAVHAGSGYPDDPTELGATLHRYLDRDADRAGSGATGEIVAIASPHASPFAAWRSYRAAYRHLGPALVDRTFVVLGTSHYGEPERFGLTIKPYVTPLGTVRTDERLLQRLVARAPGGVVEEDYAHAVEHSIEFQILFLQWLFGPSIKVVPILCGAFARSVFMGGQPEDSEGVRAFLGELGEIAAKEPVTWILGIDMAHIGRRYGDPFDVQAHDAQMVEVAKRDAQRNERILAGDADGFWGLVQERHDDLRWCGSSPLYTFLKTVSFSCASVENYEQWSIDEQSVVTFAAMRFSR